MIDINKKYTTRDGREVRIYATDGREYYPVHGAIHQGDGWQQNCWTQDGLHSLSNSGNQSSDLIEVRPRHRRTVWLNVHSKSIKAHDNRHEANLCISPRIACIKVELDFEEGEGL